MGKTTHILEDEQQRQQICTDLDTTMLVEAAAGTGKTTCLVDRMVALVRTGRCRVETLAAVTFTRKAAAELRTRFQFAVERAHAAASGDEGERLAVALGAIDRVFIGTIHAFCGRILRERPIEAGVDPEFVELDEDIDRQLREQAWRQYVAEIIATDAPILAELELLGLKISAEVRRSGTILDELSELGLDVAELGPAFMQFAGFPDVEDWPAAPRPLPDLTRCVAELEAYVAHMQTIPMPSDCGRDELLPKYEFLPRLIQRTDLSHPAELMRVLEEFKKVDVVQYRWPEKGQGKKEEARWKSFIADYSTPLLLAWREHRYEPSLRAIRPAVDIYHRLRRAAGGLNFHDLLLRSAALLRGDPEMRRYFRQRFTHLFVDEFQDTDPIQAEVMLLLTADDPTETDWQRCRPVAGSLFVVGDPKQSIYRFRRADIQTYNKVRSIIEHVGGRVIPLSANFRSAPALIDWVNTCFDSVFPAATDPYQATNRRLTVGRPSNSDQARVEHLSVGDFAKIEDVVMREADWIARTIRKYVDERLPLTRSEQERERGLPEHATPGDFLIVTRGKKRLSIYARKLQQYGLPHVVTGGSVLNQVAELELLTVCLRAVVDVNDPVALVAALRSELFGLSDVELYAYRHAGGRFSYRHEVPASLAAATAELYRAAFARLITYSGWLHRFPAPAAVERIAADLGLIAVACAHEEGVMQAGSLLKAIELLREQELLGWDDCLAALSKFVDYEELQDGISVAPPHAAPVRVMNLHQCKGLEAPFVFLVDPSGEFDHGVGLHIDRQGNAPRGYLAIYGERRGKWGSPPLLAHPPGWDSYAAEEQRYLNAEAERLRYVAATRAGTRLIVSQRIGKGNHANPWRPFERHLVGAACASDPGPVASPEAPVLNIDRAAWNAELAAIDTRWQGVFCPTYAVEAMKMASLTAAPKPRGGDPYGTEWGSLLHTLLEAAARRPGVDLRKLALATLTRLDHPLTLVDDALVTVEKVLVSDVWKRVLASPERYVEVPISLGMPATSAPSGLPTIRRGVIDLAFRESGDWVLVDYKSDRVDVDKLPELVQYYRPQLAAYVSAWTSATGEAVRESGLFFTHCGEYQIVR